MADRSPCIPLPRTLPTASPPPFFHPHVATQGTGQPSFHPGSGGSFRSPSAKIPMKNRIVGREGGRNVRREENERQEEAFRGQKRKPADDSSDDSDSSDTRMKHRRSKSPEVRLSPSARASRRRPRHVSSSEEPEPTSKRIRTGLEKQFNISKLLTTLDKPALLTVIHNLLDAHPHLQSEFASLIPRPTLQSVRPHLQALEKNLAAAFPYTKWGPDKSDYSFNRVRGSISELVDAILGYATHFTQPDEFPTTTFSYLQLATTTISRLPAWDTSAHNAPKHDALVRLAEHYLTAVRNAADKISEGKIYGQAVVGEWARDLARANSEAGPGVFQQAMREFGDRLGWIVGMAAPQQQQQQQQQQQPAMSQGPLGYGGGLFSGGQGMTQVGGAGRW